MTTHKKGKIFLVDKMLPHILHQIISTKAVSKEKFVLLKWGFLTKQATENRRKRYSASRYLKT